MAPAVPSRTCLSGAGSGGHPRARHNQYRGGISPLCTVDWTVTYFHNPTVTQHISELIVLTSVLGLINRLLWPCLCADIRLFTKPSRSFVSKKTYPSHDQYGLNTTLSGAALGDESRFDDVTDRVESASTPVQHLTLRADLTRVSHEVSNRHGARPQLVVMDRLYIQTDEVCGLELSVITELSYSILPRSTRLGFLVGVHPVHR